MNKNYGLLLITILLSLSLVVGCSSNQGKVDESEQQTEIQKEESEKVEETEGNVEVEIEQSVELETLKLSDLEGVWYNEDDDYFAYIKGDSMELGFPFSGDMIVSTVLSEKYENGSIIVEVESVTYDNSTPQKGTDIISQVDEKTISFVDYKGDPYYMVYYASNMDEFNEILLGER